MCMGVCVCVCVCVLTATLLELSVFNSRFTAERSVWRDHKLKMAEIWSQQYLGSQGAVMPEIMIMIALFKSLKGCGK